ncbi:MAG: toll/interleukin-1 receptor domain-containing protein [Burkholderiales bacterium]|nr:toll/interleukin-1 receptor domain-containing protein [Burkholderiales bacterium]
MKKLVTTRYSECKYSAFISYSLADDTLSNFWISNFRKDFEVLLKAKLNRQENGARPLHLSKEQPVVGGDLSKELHERIKQSFCMMIMVYEDYVESDWCLKELDYFKELFSDFGLEHRLYLLVLSEKSKQLVHAHKRLQDKILKDQVWVDCFYSPDDEPYYPYLDDGITKKASLRQTIEKIA